MAFNFYTPQGVDYIFSLFPDYYVEADTYKDVNGEGLLERYCRSFDQELEEIKPFVDDILLLLQPLLSNGKYLSYQSGNVGNIPLTSNLEINKRLTAWAVSLFRIKGCASSYELLFRLFDYQVKVIENFNDSRTAYDIEEPEVVRYDAEEFYYDNGCPACIEYSLEYVNYTNPMELMPEEIEDVIRGLICFIQPIDAKLTTISRAVS